MATQNKPTPPESVRGHTILRKKIWEPCNVHNEHFVGCIVGREGSAKSYTSLRIGERVDPGFSAEQIFFDPVELIEYLQNKTKEELKGSYIMLDESGVGLGNRTWYDEGQIDINQALQTVRDDNIALMFTLPRLEELDKQTKGRLKSYIEMTDKDEEKMIATGRWRNIDPSRGNEDRIYRKYPRAIQGDGRMRLTRMQFKPPQDEELVSNYEQKKDEFKQQLFDKIQDGGESSGEEETTDYQGMADEVVDRVEDFTSWHGGHNREYLDADRIQMEFDLSERDAKKVKKLASSEVEL